MFYSTKRLEYHPTVTFMWSIIFTTTSANLFVSDYVYNPKEARLRKALRDSWKDKGKHNSQEQGRCVTGKSNGENWLSPQNTQNRKLLPMPVSN